MILDCTPEDPALEMSMRRASLTGWAASFRSLDYDELDGRHNARECLRVPVTMRKPQSGSTPKPGANWVSPQPGILSPILINGAANMSHYGHIDCCWAASPAVWVG